MSPIECLSGFGRRLRMLLHREQFDRDLEEEMRLHLELKQQELQDAGVPPEKTRSLAMRQMGNELLWREASHAAWGWNGIENLLEDLRYGSRQLRKSPGFTAAAVLTLALGIGANTAIFTFIHGMLKPLPVPNPEQLYSLGDNKVCCDRSDIQEDFSLYSYALYQRIRENTPEFSEVATFRPGLEAWLVHRIGEPGPAELRVGQFVSGSYFSMFGVRASAGRTLLPTDDQPGAPPVAVMSYRTWQQRYQHDRSVVGSTFLVSGQRVTVIGVAPPEFTGETFRANYRNDFWIALAMEPVLNQSSSLAAFHAGEYWLYSIARLKPGAQPAQAEARVNEEIRQWLRDKPDLSNTDRQRIAKVHMVLTPASGGINKLWSSFAPAAHLLLIASGVLLLVACANIANLLLARSTANGLQTVVRMALAAKRTRLIQQLLTEGALLALLGGVGALAVAYALTRTILSVVFRGANYVPVDPNPSIPVIAFAFVLSLSSGLIFTIVPAWIATNTRPGEVLRGAGRSTGTNSAWLEKALVALQAGLSLVLLIGAGLLTQSLRNLQYQHNGFETQGRLVVKVDPSLSGYTLQQLPALYQTLQRRLAQIPGVLSASLALRCPAVGLGWGNVVYADGRPPAPNPAQNVAYYDLVSPHYFETIGTRLLRGRVVDERDTPKSSHVAVVNQSFANRFFPGEDPIGKRFGEADGHSRDYEIVGIVEDAKYRNLDAPADPMFFRPLLQLEKYQDSDNERSQMWGSYIDSIQLHFTGNPEDLKPVIREVLANLNPSLTIVSMRSLGEEVGTFFIRPQLVAELATFYGMLALILAAVGLYGITAYTVTRRSREIGIRMALGANGGNVTALVLRDTLLPVAWGLALGIPVALLVGSAIAHQLYGVTGHDWSILSSGVLVLLASALFAGFVPAARAASTDPMQVLRAQ
jgi:predicted permease